MPIRAAARTSDEPQSRSKSPVTSINTAVTQTDLQQQQKTEMAGEWGKRAPTRPLVSHPPPSTMANRGGPSRFDRRERGYSAASTAAPPTHDDDDDTADSDDQWEDGEVEDWDEPENAPTRCLFTDREFTSPSECLAHAASSHGLDLHLLIRRLKLDLYDKMKLVNFLRKSLRAPGADVAAVVAAVVACEPGAPEPWPWSEDTNLQPVLADDPLLYSLSMDDEEPDEAEEQACTRTCTWTRTCACQGVG